MDEVAGLADRLREKLRRGEEPGIEFLIDFASLTPAEQDEFLVLMDARAAHGEEKLEAPRANVQVLRALLDLVESSGAPPGTTVGQALVAGYVSLLEVVESIRGVAIDPLAREPE